MHIIYYPEEAFGQNALVVQSFLVRSFPSPRFTYIMSKQGNVRQCNLSPFLFFERSKSEKVMTLATNRPREETDNPVIVVNTLDETATTPKTNNKSYNTPQKEKITFKLNYLNNKKARYESHGTFITRCQKQDNFRRFKSLFGTINC